VYYHAWKRSNASDHTSKHLVLGMVGAREFIELCDAGDASKNKGDMLAMLFAVEQQERGKLPGSKVVMQ
jgi:hypothetical protein